MKRIFPILVILASLLATAGCERQPVNQYLSSIVGYWATEENSQDFASLEVVESQDGQSTGTLNVASNGTSLVTDLQGDITYNAQTGAVIFTPTEKAFDVAIQATSEGKLHMNVKEVRKGMTTVLFDGTLTNTEKPEKQKKVVECTLMMCSYYRYDANGTHLASLAGTRGNDNTVWMLQMQTTMPQDSLVGTYSLENGDFDTDLTFFIPNYSQNATEDDILYPVAMTMTITHIEDGYYSVDAKVECENVIYHISTSTYGMALFVNVRWDVELKETVDMVQTYDSIEGDVYVFEDTTQVEIALWNNRTVLRLGFITASELPKGTYPITDERKYGTAIASPGFDIENNLLSSSYLAVIGDEQRLEKIYFLRDGEVNVDYPAQDTISITGRATSYYGSSITFSYRGPFTFAHHQVGTYPMKDKQTFGIQGKKSRIPNLLLVPEMKH